MEASIQHYSLSDKRTGRRFFFVFQLINALSFSFLAGNLITLYLLKLNASATIIGIVSSFLYVSFLFMPLGRGFVQKKGVVVAFSRAWMLRYILMTGALVSPFFALKGDTVAALISILISYLCFQIMRGIGIVGWNPLMSELSSGPDRGTFLSRLQIIVQIAIIVSGLLIAFFFGPEAPYEIYLVFMSIGVVLGLTSAFLLSKIPEPPASEAERGTSLRETLQYIRQDRKFRRFITPLLLLTFFSSIFRPFSLVYAKTVYGFADNMVIILTVVGSLGAFSMGLINSMMMDHVGVKPLIILYGVLLLIPALGIVFAPILSGIAVWIFLTVFFFLGMMAVTGVDSTTQAYFYHILERKHQLNLGIIFFLLMGVSGALGSILGGGLLDSLINVHDGNVEIANRIFYAVLAIGMVISVIVVLPMERLGALSLGTLVSSLFSLRDWRAITLVHRLRKVKDPEVEIDLLQQLRKNPSRYALNEVKQRLESPMFSIRREALSVLPRFKWDKEIVELLIKQISEQEFATAYHAARLLGQRKIEAAIPSLRRALESNDYLLQSSSAIALSSMRDEPSIPKIRELLEQEISWEEEKRIVLITYCLGAVKNFVDVPSLPRVLNIVCNHGLPTHVRNEAVFTAASLMGIQKQFYAPFISFIDDHDKGLEELLDGFEFNGSVIGLIKREMELHRRVAGMEKAKQKNLKEIKETNRVIINDLKEELLSIDSEMSLYKFRVYISEAGKPESLLNSARFRFLCYGAFRYENLITL